MSKDSLLIVFCRSAERFSVSLDAFILPVPSNSETPSFLFSLSPFFSTRAAVFVVEQKKRKRKKIFLLLYVTWLFSSVCLSPFFSLSLSPSPSPSSIMKKKNLLPWHNVLNLIEPPLHEDYSPSSHICFFFPLSFVLRFYLLASSIVVFEENRSIRRHHCTSN